MLPGPRLILRSNASLAILLPVLRLSGDGTTEMGEIGRETHRLLLSVPRRLICPRAAITSRNDLGRPRHFPGVLVSDTLLA